MKCVESFESPYDLLSSALVSVLIWLWLIEAFLVRMRILSALLRSG